MSGGGMTLQTLEFVRLLPQFMRDDLAVQGLAKAMDNIVPGLTESIGRLTTWDKIETLSESELDELATELNILWYDKTAGIRTKRDLILNSDKVYKHLGTKWAVENVVTSYFGYGRVLEWFEYEGMPGHFRISTGASSLSADRLAEFINILNKVKRASSKLDSIIYAWFSELQAVAGASVHDVGKELYKTDVMLDGDAFYAFGNWESIVIFSTGAHSATGDALNMSVPLPVSADGDTIIIGN